KPFSFLVFETHIVLPGLPVSFGVRGVIGAALPWDTHPITQSSRATFGCFSHGMPFLCTRSQSQKDCEIQTQSLFSTCLGSAQGSCRTGTRKATQPLFASGAWISGPPAPSVHAPHSRGRYYGSYESHQGSQRQETYAQTTSSADAYHTRHMR